MRIPFLYLFLSGVLLPGTCSVWAGQDSNKAIPYSLTLGATRVIYPLNGAGAVLSVSNDQDYPVLVQSNVWNEDLKTKAPFVVTPPLFRLDGKQKSILRIVRVGGQVPNDRESLSWLCVKGIPPKSGDLWAENKEKKHQPGEVNLGVNVLINSCIKLLTRPGDISGQPTDVAGDLTWQWDGKKLKVNNPTPFFMNLSSVKINNVDINLKGEISDSYIPPESSRLFNVPQLTSREGEISWKIINDYGGESKVWTINLKK